MHFCDIEWARIPEKGTSKENLTETRLNHFIFSFITLEYTIALNLVSVAWQRTSTPSIFGFTIGTLYVTLTVWLQSAFRDPSMIHWESSSLASNATKAPLNLICRSSETVDVTPRLAVQLIVWTDLSLVEYDGWSHTFTFDGGAEMRRETTEVWCTYNFIRMVFLDFKFR